MKLLLLGTSGYRPTDTRQTACLLIPECGIVLDAGTGFYRVNDSLGEIPGLDIFLTHAHLDHIIGLTYLLDVFHHRPRLEVRVHGTAGALAAVEEHLFAPALFPIRPPFITQPLPEEIPLAQGGTLTSFPVVHPGGAVGFRLDWPGRSLAYVTDTTALPDAPYVEKIRGVDLLVHECYTDDSHEELARQTGHSWVRGVAETAQAAQVGRLVLVHVAPLAPHPGMTLLEQVRALFPETVLGSDRLEIEF